MPSAPQAPEIIEAKNDLRKKVRRIRRLSPADDPVKRAEAAIKILSEHFDDWMADEINVMFAARDAWRATGYRDGEERNAFYRAVHDIKGQSTTLGFPLATQVAASLCTLIERIERLEEEKKAISDDIRDVYAEAKGNGYEVKALRTIVRMRKQDADERREHETILETYMQALGML